HLDATGGRERAALALRAQVALAHVGRTDGSVGGEVAPGHQVDDVLTGDVRAGDPAGALDDAGIHDVADLGLGVLAEHARADVALDQGRVVLHLHLVHRLDLDRLELPTEALEVDVSIAGDADR